MMDRKARIAELASTLQRSVAPETIAIRELVKLLFEQHRDNLVDAEGNRMLQRQGAAQAFQRLYIQLTQPSPIREQ